MKKSIVTAVFAAMAFTAFGQVKSMAPVPMIPLEEDKVAEIESMMTDGNFCLTANYDDRGKWATALNDARREAAIREAELLVAPDGSCTMEAWQDEWVAKYWSPKKNNDTDTGKKMHSKRQKCLRALVFAECLEGRGRFVPAINDCLRKLVRSFWVMPRNYDPNAKVQNIELGANHFSSIVGQTLCIMGDEIEPELRQEALDTLYSRVFNPMLESFRPDSKHNYCNWVTSLNNWNSSCLSGVLSAALAAVPDKHTRAEFVYLANRYVDNYPAGYTPDGYCTEGMGYYNYGFDKYYFLREMIYKVTGGRIDIFARNPYIREMMDYPFKLQMYPDIPPQSNIYPAFGDCSSDSRPADHIMDYNRRYLNPDSPDSMQSDPRSLEGGFMGGGLSMFHSYAEGSRTQAEASDPLRSLFKDCGILTMRPASYPDSPMEKPAGMAVTVKGGHNKESHNHNDVGSYNICMDGIFMVEDPGIAPYTGRTFGPHRYETKTINSYGHACPSVDGTLQATVGETAPVKLASFSDEKDEFALELCAFYPEVEDITSMLRGFTYLREKNEFIVNDEFSAGSAHIWESAVSTRAGVRVKRNSIILSRDGKRVRARIKSSVPVSIMTETIGGPEGEDARDPYIRISVKTRKAVSECSMAIDFKAL